MPHSKNEYTFRSGLEENRYINVWFMIQFYFANISSISWWS